MLFSLVQRVFYTWLRREGFLGIVVQEYLENSLLSFKPTDNELLGHVGLVNAP
jgi:hypothetical protein